MDFGKPRNNLMSIERQGALHRLCDTLGVVVSDIPTNAVRVVKAVLNNKETEVCLSDKLLVTEFTVPIKKPESVFVRNDINIQYVGQGQDLVKPITQAIRYCDHVVVCLAEKCLPLSVVNELKWLVDNGYDARLVVATKELAQIYHGCSEHIEVNAKVNASFVVVWKQDRIDSFLLGDTIYKIDGGEELVKLLDGKKTKIATELTVDLFAGASEVYYGDSGYQNKSEWEKISKLTAARLSIIGLSRFYNAATFQYFADKKYKLLAIYEESVKDRIWIITDKLYCVVRLLGGYIKIEAGYDDAQSFIKPYYYTPVYLADNVVKNEPKNSYRLNVADHFEKSDIQQCKVLTSTIEAADIDAYLTDSYDKRFMEEYTRFGDYCAVRYEVTLQPPILPPNAIPSVKYPSLVSLLNDSQAFIVNQTAKIAEARSLFESINKNEGEISSWLDAFSDIAKEMGIMDGRKISSYTLTMIRDSAILCAEDISPIVDAYKTAMKKVVGGDYSKKTDKFDVEIEVWKKKIAEFTAGRNDDNYPKIDKKIREAEEEIATLEALKPKLTARAAESGDEDVAAIMERLEAFLQTGKPQFVFGEDETLDRVIGSYEDKVAKYEQSTITLVDALLKFRKHVIGLQKAIKALDLPTTGILYTSHQGTSLIAIKNCDEIAPVRAEAKRYSAKIVADRNVQTYGKINYKGEKS
jgi:hypothetical protein